MKTNVIVRSPATARQASFRSYLQQELARRCAANSQYSLRSFALHLDTDHSSLSQIMRGKRARRGQYDFRLHHYAILELIRLKDFRPDSRWIARVLGITTDEVNVVQAPMQPAYNPVDAYSI